MNRDTGGIPAVVVTSVLGGTTGTAAAFVPDAVTADQLDIARARLACDESVTAIAAHLGVGRSTLYRALQHDASGPA